MERNDNDTWEIHLSRSPKEGNWLPIGEEESFSLLLRLYRPDNVFYDDPGGAELPSIVREGP